MPEEVKEIDVFRKYSKNNKLGIVLIAVLIASLIVTAVYFFAKSLFTYTVTFELNGGYVYGVDDPTLELDFLERVFTPFAKKEGYFLEGWYKDEELTKPFKEGSRIWNDMTLYAGWEQGYAIRLNFAEGEENDDLSTKELKMRYEQYVELGDSWSLPKVFNENKNSKHYGEQLLWYEDITCSKDPFESADYVVTETKDIYGKWFDTKKEKFDVDSNGVLNDYLGYSRHIILPSNVKSIRSIKINEFRQGYTDQQVGREYHSVFQNVIGVNSSTTALNIIYLNKELESIGECAFRNCTSLRKVVFLGNTQTIGNYAFSNCFSLVDIKFPSSISKISKGCFDGAFATENEVKLNLSNSVTVIEDGAFRNSKIHSIVLNNVSFIGKNAFAACHSLRKIYFNFNQVITTNCDSADESTGVFDNTYTYDPNAQHFVIVVPEDLLISYQNAPCWNWYSDIFVSE